MRRALTLVSLSFVPACEGAEEPPPPECSVAWQDVVPPREGHPPGELVWHDGQLFFPVGPEVGAVSEGGGEVKTAVRLNDFPISLLSAGGWLLIDQAGWLYRASFAGGVARLVASPKQQASSHWAADENVDPERAYEVFDPLFETGEVSRLVLNEAFALRKTVEFSPPAEHEALTPGRDEPLSGALSTTDRSWQLSADPGRGREVITTFALPTQMERMVISRDTLFLSGLFGGDFYALPRAGGPLTSVTKDASLLGGGPEGLVLSLWAPELFAPGRPMFAPTGGGPLVPFWPARPRGTRPRHVWPAGEGRWLVLSSEQGAAGAEVTTLRVLNPDGHTGPPACEPRGEITAVATSPEFFYLVAGHTQGSTPWHLLRIRRQDLAAR